MKKSKKKVNKSKIMLILSFLFMMMILAYLLLNSNLFNSTNIKIEGNTKIENEEIIDMLGISDDKNIFKYNKKQMEDMLVQNKYIESAKVKIKLPNELNVMIIEKDIAAILKYEEDYTYISYDGSFIDTIDNIEKSEETIVEIKYKVDGDGRIKYENEEIEKRLLYLLESIKTYSLKNKIDNISIEDYKTINLFTKENIKAIIPNDDNIKYNISMLKSILIDLQSQNIDYGTIDFVSGDDPIYRP